MTIRDQVEWEGECSTRGSERYYANQERLRDNGQGDTTEVMSFLIKDRLEDAGDYLKELVKRGSRGKAANYNTIIRQVAQDDYLKITYIGLKAVLKAIQIKDKNALLKVSLDIAARVEVDLKCQMFEAAYPEYYDTVRKSFASQNITDYTHKQKVMMKKFGDFEIDWNDWSPTQKVQIGTRVLKAILNTFGDIIFVYKEYYRGKTINKLNTTAEFDTWAKEFERERGLLYPMYLPLKTPPRPWTTLKDGGYHTYHLRLKLVKTKGKAHRDYVNEHLPLQHMKAVNKLQRTGWKINTDVLAVQEEVYTRGLGIGMPSNERITPPPFPKHLADIEKVDLTDDQKEEVKGWKILAKSAYGKEQQRKGQVLAFMQGHKLAKEIKDWEKLYFAYTCDFRGRVYCATSGLSPQGADPAKGLLTFSKGVVLGKHGCRWLAIHGANTYGIDKVSYTDRVRWITNMEGSIQRVVEDPIENRHFWGDADKPYQFLAFCFEWANCDYGRNNKAVSNLPIGLDGSCNGIQHFSAMLKDEVGAKATNLTECKVPEDIYGQVADVTMQKLRKSTDPMAKQWLHVKVDRKCAKRPVMTLPYGATQQSARVYILEYVIDNWSKFKETDESTQWEYAKFLTPLLWAAISEVVVAARTGMDWLQRNSKHGYVKWLTPLGFPVYQYYKKVDATRVFTQLDGTVEIWLRDLDREGVPNKTSQRNGIAPNFIHSIDSTHMVMTVNNTDLSSYAMVHDDFGTHAGNTEYLFRHIRHSFYKLYSKHDPLREWAKQLDIDTEDMPKSGVYAISSIYKADYFFG